MALHDVRRYYFALMDLDWINARLAVGAAVNAQDVEAIAAAGVTHIVDCQLEFDDTAEFAAHPQISVLWNGTADDGATKPPEWFGKSIAFALSAFTAPHAKVYCHCAAGVNRGPSTAYAVLRAQGWVSIIAEQAIRSVRPQVGLAYKVNADTAIEELGYD